ncbi:phosphoenolpyruvate carboxykinase (ATP) [Sediminibacillus albus]|uniref:Phosphoenolpyruvate carboxykinase (ATP) n=1 Tax=Sediminibacillus albus TaxID=407036 RepID=A0A1G8Z1X2_9BACI|nr:phosphoenolpyruvate carboxykinase (ATP) [Sediminibacillus albus]SDK09041.1 phosphoenolpyruvate carboxykinase (ATP) [Sediminibacillus albus]
MNKINESVLTNELTGLPNCSENLSIHQLTRKITARGEGHTTNTGAVSVVTGKYTGRSPEDKFIVQTDELKDNIDWGKVNKPIDQNTFYSLYIKVVNHLRNQDEFFSFTGYAGADQHYRLPIKVITEFAWHNLFARQLFIEADDNDWDCGQGCFTVISAPSFKADPELDGTNSEAFIIISMEEKVILIGGTEYAGEIKKSVFSVMNYLLPQKNVLPMHCSANVDYDGDVSLFFGLSGTGKTTLSADPGRLLIGDDEHAWSPNGIFNIEGGCYAKCVGLSRDKEPQIYDSIQNGAVLENVICTDGVPDFDNTSLTENTRAAYPLRHINNSVVPSTAGHPRTIIFLTADASGVLPPISRLNKEQAMYHFMSGYTSKLAGTERGVTKPQATFSACFGAPFLPLNPRRYADMLGEKIDKHGVDVFLINTGWIEGPFGKGKRIPLEYTRAMVRAALQGELDEVDSSADPIFGLQIPVTVPEVPEKLLRPWETWNSYESYKLKAEQLAARFHENFEKFTDVDSAIVNAGPLYKPV